MVIVSLISSILFVVMNTFSLWMISSLIGTIMKPNVIKEGLQNKVIGDLSINQKLEQMAQTLIGSGSQLEQLKMLCIILLISFLFKNIFFYINNVSLSFVQNKMIQDIRNKVFKHLHNLPMSFYDKNKSGEITSIVLHDVSALRTAFTQSIQKLINEPLNIIVLVVMLFLISTKLTLIAIITIPLSAFVIVKLGQSIRRKAKRSSKQIAGVINILQESISGIRIVKAFAKEKFENSQFQAETKKFFALLFRQDKLRFLTTPVNDMVGVSMGVILLWIGGNEVISNQSLTSDEFLRFIIFLFAMLQPARKLGNVNAQIQTGLASATRVFSILDTKNDIQDGTEPIIIDSFKDNIQFSNVTFQYESAEKPSLKNINTDIKKGEIVALVGSSGAGKSTFVDLIPRFYDVESGTISIDSTNIKEVSQLSLRSLMGIVTQEVILFNDTVANNIAYGVESANTKQIKEAAIGANALEFIENLPDGFDTIIGEKGTRLSGGQKQRLSIARAIMKNPEILILDEATSALDTESERKVQIAIDNLVQNRTVIVIAHRLSTITKANKILVFDNGQLIESGTHNELIEKTGHYKKLYDIQFETDSN